MECKGNTTRITKKSTSRQNYGNQDFRENQNWMNFLICSSSDNNNVFEIQKAKHQSKDN